MDDQFIKRTDGVFINNDSKELRQYNMARERAYRERERDQKIERLEREIAQIKQILQKHIVAQRNN